MIVSRRLLLRGLAGGVASGLLAQSRKPNIVLIVADDLGNQDMGFQGSPDLRTPHLDGLAASGVRFTNGYVSHPFCSPTRAALLTGRYQQRFGHENNMVFNQQDPLTGLPLTETTLADALGKAGYMTGLVGKWHLGAHEKFHPRKRGFQEMYGFVGGGHDYFHPGVPGDKDQHFIPIERDGVVVPEKEYLTTALGREAEAFVRRHAARPFFLYLAFNAPHSPLQAPQAYLRKFAHIQDPDRRSYAAMVGAMDDAVGRVLLGLRETNNEQNTLVFFLSDNGGPRDNASSNKPFRGTKRTVYEGGVRVPFALRWPAAVAGGRMVEDPVICMDIFPTALAAAGAKHTGKALDGVNLLPWLQGKAAAPRRPLYWRMFGGVEGAVRDGQMKWVKPGAGKAPELYDLASDKEEKNNLAGVRPEEAARLEKLWGKWSGEMAAPAWLDHIFDKERLGHK
ncbi:MAG: sulfatase-like hydrolase/transferase [Bryobacterales bacterium]|nr:sulfatase-like hydrolase/transferase [Bryobacterales bacterium]